MKKSILLFSLMIAVQHLSVAQTRTIDSLRAALKTAGQDTNKVNILNALSYELLYSNTDTTIYYANLANSEAGKINVSGST